MTIERRLAHAGFTLTRDYPAPVERDAETVFYRLDRDVLVEPLHSGGAAGGVRHFFASICGTTNTSISPTRMITTPAQA